MAHGQKPLVLGLRSARLVACHNLYQNYFDPSVRKMCAMVEVDTICIPIMLVGVVANEMSLTGHLKVFIFFYNPFILFTFK